ncbi:MAG: YybH family protein [Burkholderiaceae bacterium]|jgi:ketosteroid isomerase-like protein
MEKEDFHTALFTSADAVEQAFYQAMERGDLEGMMQCWLDEDDIVCLHPNGPRLVGTDAIRRGWQQIFDNGAVKLRVSARHSQSSMMVSVHNVVEWVQVKNAEGTVGEIALFATNVYAKTALGWRMILHHASPVPEQGLPETQEEPARPSILH